jgi:hypothetical protein
MDQWLLHAQA